MAEKNFAISTIVSMDTAQALAKVKTLQTAVDKLDAKASSGIKVEAGGGRYQDSRGRWHEASGKFANMGGGSTSGGGSSSGGFTLPGLPSIGFGASGKGFFSGIGAIGSTLMSAASGFANAVMSGLTMAVDLAASLGKTLLVGAGAFAAAIVGGIYAAHKAMAPAAEMERYKLQLSAMGKAERLGGYERLAKEGPQDIGQMVRGGISLESFGIDSSKYLQTVQDSAAMFGRDMSEVAGILSRVKSGQLEIEQMNMIGLSRQDLTRQGVKFGKSGEVDESSKAKLFDAFIAAMQAKSGGMAKTMSTGYEGSVSNLGDAVKSSFANAFKEILPYATQTIQSITDVVENIGSALGKIDWRGAGEQLVSLAQRAGDLVSSVDWKGIGDTFAGMTENALAVMSYMLSSKGWTEMGSAISQSINTIMSGLPELMTYAGVAINESIQEGGDWLYGKLLDWSDVLVSAFSTGKDILSSGLSSAFILGSRTIVSGMAAIMSYIPGIKNLVSGQIVGNLETMNFGQRQAAYADIMKTRMISTKGEESYEAWKADREIDRRSLGAHSGIRALGDLEDKGMELAGKAAESFKNLIQSAITQGKNPEATALVEKRKRDLEDMNARKSMEKQAAIEKAIVMGNALTSQLLQEFRAFNEISQSDIAEAMRA